MNIYVSPLQKLGNSKSNSQKYSPKKHGQSGGFAAVLQGYVGGGVRGATPRQDSFEHQPRQPQAPPRPALQSDVTQLFNWVRQVNAEITALIS